MGDQNKDQEDNGRVERRRYSGDSLRPLIKILSSVVLLSVGVGGGNYYIASGQDGKLDSIKTVQVELANLSTALIRSSTDTRLEIELIKYDIRALNEIAKYIDGSRVTNLEAEVRDKAVDREILKNQEAHDRIFHIIQQLQYDSR